MRREQIAETERGAGLIWLVGPYLPLVDDVRLGVAAVDDAGHGLFGRELHQQRRGEPFREQGVRMARVRWAVQRRDVPAGPFVQLRHHLAQRRFPVRQFTEGAEQGRRGADGLQSLAPYVADHDPGPVRRAQRLVEVAAHPRLRLGRQIHTAQGERADPVGEGVHQGALRGLGDGADLTQLPLPALPQGACAQ
nr:hypothetical protein [Streptomyces fodineus]